MQSSGRIPPAYSTNQRKLSEGQDDVKPKISIEIVVIQYVEDAGATAERLSFTSEQIENIPAGWRARETYLVRGADQFDEIFELAEPGKAFEVYSNARLTRVR